MVNIHPNYELLEEIPAEENLGKFKTVISALCWKLSKIILRNIYVSKTGIILISYEISILTFFTFSKNQHYWAFRYFWLWTTHSKNHNFGQKASNPTIFWPKFEVNRLRNKNVMPNWMIV
jgi:hypothetical protein